MKGFAHFLLGFLVGVLFCIFASVSQASDALPTPAYAEAFDEYAKHGLLVYQYCDNEMPDIRIKLDEAEKNVTIAVAAWHLAGKPDHPRVKLLDQNDPETMRAVINAQGAQIKSLQLQLRRLKAQAPAAKKKHRDPFGGEHTFDKYGNEYVTGDGLRNPLPHEMEPYDWDEYYDRVDRGEKSQTLDDWYELNKSDDPGRRNDQCPNCDSYNVHSSYAKLECGDCFHKWTPKRVKCSICNDTGLIYYCYDPGLHQAYGREECAYCDQKPPAGWKPRTDKPDRLTRGPSISEQYDFDAGIPYPDGVGF